MRVSGDWHIEEVGYKPPGDAYRDDLTTMVSIEEFDRQTEALRTRPRPLPPGASSWSARTFCAGGADPGAQGPGRGGGAGQRGDPAAARLPPVPGALAQARAIHEGGVGGRRWRRSGAAGTCAVAADGRTTRAQLRAPQQRRPHAARRRRRRSAVRARPGWGMPILLEAADPDGRVDSRARPRPQAARPGTGERGRGRVRHARPRRRARPAPRHQDGGAARHHALLEARPLRSPRAQRHARDGHGRVAGHQAAIEKVQAGEPLSEREASAAYSAYQTAQHEINHGVNPVYAGRASRRWWGSRRR